MPTTQISPCFSRMCFFLLLLFKALQPGLAARPLLVFLLDGFRYDYIDELHELPGFRELVERGVKVDYMTPDFPSLFFFVTLPVHNTSCELVFIQGTLLSRPQVIRLFVV
uniref:Uncharacterized protein n=1 Tax=Poecilia latipinna TaxID=48699 RepID=A0A3B3USQ8_9TELE